jgi:hypothetical protein
LPIKTSAIIIPKARVLGKFLDILLTDNKGLIATLRSSNLPPRSVCANVSHSFAALWLIPAAMAS